MPKPSRIPDQDAPPESGRRQTRESGATLETVPKRARRVFSAADKLRIVKEADACLTSGKRGDLEGVSLSPLKYLAHPAALSPRSS